MYIVPAATVAGLGLGAVNASQVGAKKPGATPSGESLEELGQALLKRIEQVSPGSKPPALGLNVNTPPADASLLSIMKNTSPYASNGPRVTGDGFDININPNADRSYLAHELGHVASAQTGVGKMIRGARGNPGLTRALAGAAILGGGASAALEDGDDDLATSVALAYAASAPTIADEFLASKNALSIMDTAGMRANMGQRARLAGGFLSYLGAPLLLGATTNLVGNQFDEDPVSSGELRP